MKKMYLLFSLLVFLSLLVAQTGNKVKAKILQKQPTFGSFVVIGHPSVAEVLSLTGVDFLWIEGEHSALSLPEIVSLNMAAHQNNVATILRVPSNNFDVIKQYVDTGVNGIIVPNIRNAQEAKQAVRALKYPPEGERGIGLGRATRYFIQMKEYLATANRDVMVILMIEHKDAVANIEEIVQVSGIDLLSIGPFDLSASFGLPGQIQHPLVQKAIQKVELVAQQAGIPLGISVSDRSTARSLQERGYSFFVIGADVEYLYQGAKRFFATSNDKLDWKIDPNIKFSYAYLENPSLATFFRGRTESAQPVAFSPKFKPDITNIPLTGIVGLGFPLPTCPDAEKHNLYLKLYEYPTQLNPKISSTNVIAHYLLDKIPGQEIIRNTIENPNNVNIKHAVIAETKRIFDERDPFPTLNLPKNSEISAQAIFDSSIPFLSLYLLPNTHKPSSATLEEQAKWSVQGMLAFYQSLIQIYQENLITLPSPDENYLYFLQPQYHTPVASFSTPNQCVILKIPKQPMVFAKNFLDLPMPQNPERFFLSGLLLVYRTNYITSIPWAELIQNENWHKTATPTHSQVLEVASVVEIEK